MREALFSILGAVDGLRVLDLYAGSGALGIEALSRGASAAVFVDSSRTAVAAIDANLDELGADNGEVIERDVLDWLRSAGSGAFDLVFCDPPYDAAPRIAQSLTELLPRVAAPRSPHRDRILQAEPARARPAARRRADLRRHPHRDPP